MSWLRNGFVFLFLFTVSGCGFRPLYYGESSPHTLAGSDLSAKLAQVFVNEIPTRNGQLLRRQITDIIASEKKGVKPRFTLEVALNPPTEEQQGIRQDNIATRTTLTYVVTYKLRRWPDNALIMTDTTSAMGSYNIVASPYATETAERALKERLMSILGNDIALRLSVYLRNHPQLFEEEQPREENP